MLPRSTLLALLLAALPAQADQVWLPSVSAGVVTLLSVDPPRVVRELPIPKGLVAHVEGALLAADNRTLLITDRQLERVVGLDLHGERLPWMVSVPEGPEAAHLSADGRQLAVCAERAGRVVYVDVTEHRVVGSIRIEGAQPEDCTFSPDGRWLVTTRRGEAAVNVIDLHDGRLRQHIATGGEPSAMLFSGDRLWLAIAQADRVEVVDTRDWKLQSVIAAGRQPVALAVQRGGGAVYVACRASGTVAVIDATRQRLRSNIAAGPAPSRLALSADGRRLLVTGRAPPYALVIDTGTLRPLGRVPLPRAPWGALFQPAG